MKKVNFLVISTLLLGVASCSSNYKRPESFESKMARFSSQDINKNKVPNYVLPDFDYNKLKVTKRGPASAGDELNFDIPRSNKKLYFLGLLGQYNSMKTFLTQAYAPEVNICPNFHTTLLNHKEVASKNPFTNSNFRNRYTNFSEEEVKNYPELSLPMTADSTSPRVVDILRNTKNLTHEKTNAVITKALRIHIKKTYDEIYELCDTGTSENYYIFENMITAVNKDAHKFTPGKESLKKFFKVTVFSNIALMKSLKNAHINSSRFPASAIKQVDYSKAISSRMKANWAYDYIQESY
ncbi:MAG: hypothetical protein GY909_03050 [Oligoflexia bacterium]|nr:hypothetical protein [Oligoflexia bacterium]